MNVIREKSEKVMQKGEEIEIAMNEKKQGKGRKMSHSIKLTHRA
jgi:hypothetical protein